MLFQESNTSFKVQFWGIWVLKADISTDADKSAERQYVLLSCNAQTLQPRSAKPQIMINENVLVK